MTHLSSGPVGFGFGRGRGRWGAVGAIGGMATTTETTFIEGTLVIDAYIPATRKMVWHGTAEAAGWDVPEKATKHIEKSPDKLFEKWEKIRVQRKQGEG